MKVADIHAIEPLADSYEFDSSKQYVIYVPYGTDIQAMIRRGNGLGIRAQIIAVEDPKDIKWTNGH